MLETMGQGSPGGARLWTGTRQRAARPGAGCADLEGGARGDGWSTTRTRASSGITSAARSPIPRRAARLPNADAWPPSSTQRSVTRHRYRQEPTEYYYPGLPAIEFYERDRVPVAAGALQLYHGGHRSGSEPRPPARGGNGIHALHPLRHSTCRLTSGAGSIIPCAGAPTTSTIMQNPIEDRCRKAPATIAAVSRPAAGGGRAAGSPRDANGACPEDPDSAAYGCRELPSGRASAARRARRVAAFVSAARSRERRVGEAWVFDDTIEHDAWNDRTTRAHFDLRRMESSPVPGRARRDRGYHRRDRRVQRHGCRRRTSDSPGQARRRVSENQEPPLGRRNRAD